MSKRKGGLGMSRETKIILMLPDGVAYKDYIKHLDAHRVTPEKWRSVHTDEEWERMYGK